MIRIHRMSVSCLNEILYLVLNESVSLACSCVSSYLMIRNSIDVKLCSFECIFWVKWILWRIYLLRQTGCKNFSIECRSILTERHGISNVHLNDLFKWIFLTFLHFSFNLSSSYWYCSSNCVIKVFDILMDWSFTKYFGV